VSRTAKQRREPREDAEQVEASDRVNWSDDDAVEMEIEEPTAVDLADEQVADEVESEPAEDSIQLYLQEIGQVPLLTAQDEVDLAQSYEAGRAARQRLRNEDYVDNRERMRLELQQARGDEARRRLIQANLRLVVSVAKKYIGSAMPFLDLVQEGNIGLMRAVEKFDYRRGHRFSTYATWWIRQAVTRSIAEQSRLIRLPVHLSESIVQLRRAMYRLEQELEREPTAEELAHALGVSMRKIKRLLSASIQPISLEQPVNSDGEGSISDIVADDKAVSPLEIASQNMLQSELAGALAILPERERRILALRYGLDDGRQRTLEEIGAAFGITRERTRQIESEALRRLRHPSVGGRLAGYLD
jgi:RNA polymerase primary sigma factor